jgi:hypothetical protein
MAIEVDHVFICCSPGAPEADALVRLGLSEGSPNTHPGQGTANRRFFFQNVFLELLWVSSPQEAFSPQTRRTGLWERWSSRESMASPFGIVFRPKAGHTGLAPFATWQYRPQYLPPGLVIEVAENTTLQEPALFYLPFAQRSGPPLYEPLNHRLPVRRVDNIAVGLPAGALLSEPSLKAASASSLRYFPAEQHLLELTFTAADPALFDLRPILPLLFRAVKPSLS